MPSYPLRIWDPATGTWLAVCGPPGPQGPAGPPGETGSAGAGLPVGGEPGDLLWWDGSARQILPPDGVAGHVLTEVESGGGAVLPAWGGVEAVAAFRQCGIAQRLAGQIEHGYDYITSVALTAVQVAINTTGGVDEAVTALVSVFTGPFSIFVGIADAVSASWSGADYLAAAQTIPPLTPGQADALIAAVYCALRGIGESTDITTDTIAAIKTQIDAYPNWSSTYQRDVLKAVLDALPLMNWQTWAAQGAAQPSAACTGYGCG